MKKLKELNGKVKELNKKYKNDFLFNENI